MKTIIHLYDRDHPDTFVRTRGVIKGNVFIIHRENSDHLHMYPLTSIIKIEEREL